MVVVTNFKLHSTVLQCTDPAEVAQRNTNSITSQSDLAVVDAPSFVNLRGFVAQMRRSNQCTRRFAASVQFRRNSSFCQNIVLLKVCCHHHSISIFMRHSSRVFRCLIHTVCVSFVCKFQRFVFLRRLYLLSKKNRDSHFPKLRFFWQCVYFDLVSLLFPFGHRLAQFSLDFGIFDTLMHREFTIQT